MVELSVPGVDIGYASAYSAVEEISAGPSLHRDLSFTILESE
jgi:hypothetical protein